MKPYRIINIVDSVNKLNFGIWNSAISTAALLTEEGIRSELWYPKNEQFETLENIQCVPIEEISMSGVGNMTKQRGLNPLHDIIITHGCWQFPTKWGSHFKNAGFKWIYTPHGMLEPWALSQKRIKKILYFNLIEKQLAKKATIVRAVGSPEQKNLQVFFPRQEVRLIPNGVSLPATVKKNYSGVREYLFLSRLHEKKGVLQMIKGWSKSELNNNPLYKLSVAGPDQGELVKIQPYLNQSKNIHYLGAIYGDDKEKLLSKCMFYLLPSFSEGFPTSVLEAMSFGLIPFITPGCNLPEAIEQDAAFNIAPDEDEICAALNRSKRMTSNEIILQSDKTNQFVARNYSIQQIAKMQEKLIHELFQSK